MPIKIIIADDNRLLSELLAGNLVDARDIEVVAVVENGREAVNKANEMNPDIVLMDIDMPVLDGVEATTQLVRDLPGIRVIALTGHSKNQYIKKMLEAGASGYLNKNCGFEELVKAIHTVYSGNKYLSEEITDIVIKDYLEKDVVVHGSDSELSERETEILKLIVDGIPVSAIADRLFVSVKTVNTHRQNILEKLNLKSTADLVKYALIKGIISLDQEERI
ncbi:MAG: response regulator transcription factor [Bacteroidales bacterium]|nr:response regulator transcription factor [Bacteroidales bacterium]